MFGFGRDEVFGLDIGSSAVKVVALRKDKAGYVVTAAAIADVPQSRDNGTRGGSGPIRAIRDCIQLTGIQTKSAVCGVCGSEVAVRDFTFPSLSPGEIEGAALLEARQICPFNTEDGAVDYQLMSNGNDGSRGVLVAATNTAIQNKAQLASDASLKCVLMDVDGLALLNCFNECEEPQLDGAAPVLNVGHSYTTLALGGDRGLPFVRDIAFAGRKILEEIAAENDMSTETVQEILFDGPMDTESLLCDSLERACEKLIVDVNETLRYNTAQDRSRIAENMFICGGFALSKEFVKLLNHRLPIEVVLWNPFEKIPCAVGKEQQDILQSKGPAMAVAAGLAMRSF